MKKRIIDKLVSSIFAVLYSWSMTTCIIHSMNFEDNNRLILLYCVISILIFNIVLYNKATLLSAALLLVGVAVYGSYKIVHLKLAAQIYQTVYREIYKTLLWFYDYIKGTQYLDIMLSRNIVIFLTLLISLFAFISIVRCFRFMLVLPGGILYFVVTFAMGYKIYIPGFIGYSFSIICLYARRVFQKSKVEYSKDSILAEYAYMLWVMPLAAAILLPSYGLSIPIEHKPVEWLHQIAENTQKWYQEQDWDLFKRYDSKGDQNFSLVTLGFQSNSEAGGNVTPDKRTALYVKSDHRLYLKGSIRDRYTGSNWVSTSQQQFILKDQNIERYITDNYFSNSKFFFELLKFARYPENQYDEIYEQVFLSGSAEVEHIRFKTKIFFYPDNIVQIKEWNYPRKALLINSNSEIYFRGWTKSDYRYSYNYKIIDRTNPLTEELLRLNSNLHLYNNALGTQSNTRMFNGEEDVLNKYDEIKKIYTGLENIPKRVTDLAKEITKDYSNKYDKVKAIEKYLSTQYEYTLAPGITPKGKDFVDYFLFDLKKGYCTYYASAMTVMVRSIGFPARYVEGYVLPPETEGSNIYRVTNDFSHAWVEVFFEGFGWVRFEPTSPYNELFGSLQGENPFYTGTAIYDEEDLDEDIEDDIIDFDIYTTQTLFSKLKDAMPTILIGVILLILCILAARRIVYAFRIAQLLKMNPNRSIVAFYRKIIYLMNLYNFARRSAETPLEYAKRVDTWFVSKEDNLTDITKIYIKARYGYQELTEEDKNRVIAFYDLVIRDLKAYLNIFIFYYLKYIKLQY